MQPAAPQPLLAQPPAPTARNRRPLWIGAIVLVVIAALAVGSYFTFRSGGPSSVDELKALLVDVPGKSTTVDVDTGEGHSVDRETGRQVPGTSGVRWSATRGWQDRGSTSGGITLTQYDSSGHASNAIAGFRAGMGSGDTVTVVDVPGVDDGFTLVGPNIQHSVLDNTPIQSVLAAGVKGTIVVLVFTSTESVDWARALLVKQVDALP